MSRVAAVERALTYFYDGRYIDVVAHRFAILTESQKPERLPNLYRYLTEEMQPAFDDNADGFLASRTDPDHPWPSYIAASVMRTTGEKIVELPNSGGSMCNYISQNTLGLPLFWIPHSYVGCSQYAPHEFILKRVMREGIALMAGVYWDIGDPATPARS
tara:strand:- start:172 stop:648 length:477 start_codon:yes stop_codon:yes gene_type:complete